MMYGNINGYTLTEETTKFFLMPQRQYKTSMATNMPRKFLAPQLQTAPQSPN